MTARNLASARNLAAALSARNLAAAGLTAAALAGPSVAGRAGLAPARTATASPQPTLQDREGPERHPAEAPMSDVGCYDRPKKR